MLLLTTRGGSRYRKLPEGTITPLRQAQQTDARLTKIRHTSLAQGVPRPLFALTCPASAITFFKLPPTAAVL